MENREELKKQIKQREVNKQRNKKIHKIGSIVLIVCIVVSCILGVGYRLYKKNNETQAISISPSAYTNFIPSGAYEGATHLEKVIIPDTIEAILSSFNDCVRLKTVQLSKNLQYTCGSFVGCSALEEIDLPESMLCIGYKTFEGCTSLKKVTINSGLLYIGEDAFKDCNQIEYNETATAYYLGNEDNPYLVLMKLKNKNDTSFEFENKTRLIAPNAFENSNLENIIIPENVIFIGTSAFLNCKNLKSVEIKGIVKDINALTFAGCTSLKTLLLSNNLKKINKTAFQDCTSLEYNVIEDSQYLGSSENPKLVYMGAVKAKATIKIESDTKVIGPQAFKDNGSVCVIYINKSVQGISKNAFEGNLMVNVKYGGTIDEWYDALEAGKMNLVNLTGIDFLGVNLSGIHVETNYGE